MPDTYTKLIATDIVRSYDVAIGATSTQGQEIGNDTRFLRIISLVDCRFTTGENPIATATSTLLPAGMVDYIAIGKNWHIAVIQEAGTGFLNVTECR